MIRAGVFITSAVLLAGCSSSNDAMTSSDSNSYHYQCSEDKQFSADYLIEEQGALVRVGDVDYALIQVPSGSGTRYILPNNAQTEVKPVTLYTKGDYARLELGREIYKNCESK